MDDRVTRTNEYTVEPTTDRYRECLFDWLAGHAPLWNQINYRRRQAYFDSDGDVWEVEYEGLYDDYAPLLGKATCQQVVQKNTDAWESFFTLLDKYHDESDQSVTEKPSPPGYWGNRDDGHELHGLVRNDLYTFDWNPDRSTLEFGVGDVLEDCYDFDYNERLTLDVYGEPQWTGDDSRLELVYDESAAVLRVKHPVRIQPDAIREQRMDAFTHTLHTENTTYTAAIDLGANNTLAIVTDTGETAVFHTRPCFEVFQQDTESIADLQSELSPETYSCRLIQRRYDHRRRKRDHSRNAAVKAAANWLLERNVNTVIIGDLTGVLSTHWQAEVNEKTHSFWSHRQLIERIELTFGDVGINVFEESERNSSSVCPRCGSESLTRMGDGFRCHACTLDAHADVVGAWNLLQDNADDAVRPMARPAPLSAGRPRDAPDNPAGRDGAYWEWNGHDWRPTRSGAVAWREHDRPFDQTSMSEPVN